MFNENVKKQIVGFIDGFGLEHITFINGSNTYDYSFSHGVCYFDDGKKMQTIPPIKATPKIMRRFNQGKFDRVVIIRMDKDNNIVVINATNDGVEITE
jgi:hypothetical protein